jgi:cob(I)alamin adenosyltransferase
MSIATKTGDDGTTALLCGRRLSKAHPRVVANGSIDELNAALGLARAFVEHQELATTIYGIQKELVQIMGDVAVAPADRPRFLEKGFKPATPEMVERLTAFIDDIEQNHHITYEHWATPGATKSSAFFDHARTVCRRAERDVIALRETGEEVNVEIVRYLNRLSDLCWLYARYVETRAGV